MSYSVVMFVGEGINLLKVYVGKFGTTEPLYKNNSNFEPLCGVGVVSAILTINGERANIGICYFFSFANCVYINKFTASNPNFSISSSGNLLNAFSNGVVKNKLGLIPEK